MKDLEQVKIVHSITFLNEVFSPETRNPNLREGGTKSNGPAQRVHSPLHPVLSSAELMNMHTFLSFQTFSLAKIVGVITTLTHH